MKISRSDLQSCKEPQVLQTTFFDIGIGDLGSPETPVELVLQTHQQGQDFLVQGNVHSVFNIPCDRCLGSTPSNIQGQFRAWLVPGPLPEVNLGEEEWISFPAHRKEVDLSELISRTIYLELPKKVLCREDCQGLCPICGIDLNRISCKCKSRETDERLSALLSVKQKLKE